MAKPLNCFLVTIHSADGEATRVVNENTFTIGRASDCAISFSDLNVSRWHLIVKNMGGKVYVEDQNSANGTFVNGSRIEAKRLIQVQPEDHVRLGSSGPIVSIKTVEPVFNEREDREVALGLVSGAHAEEAQKAAQLDQTLANAVSESLAAAREEATQLLREAQGTAMRTLEEAKYAAQGVLDDAKIEAEKCAREHKEGSEREADAYFAKRHQEIEQLSIKKAAEVDEYRAEQERTSREQMAKEIDTFIREKRELENAVLPAKAELEQVLPRIEGGRAELATLNTKNLELRAEVKKLNAERADLAAFSRLAEDQVTFENEAKRRRTALAEELNSLRHSELERLRRERECLGKKILVEVQQAVVSTIPVDQWRGVAAAVETVIQENLKLYALSQGAEDSLAPLTSQVATSRKRLRVMHTAQGFFLGVLFLVAGWQGTVAVFNAADPMKAQIEDNARPKFDPPQDEELRTTYAESVIYTRGFVAKYQDSEFQKHWFKKASKYFFKKWKVQEDSVEEALAATSTLVSSLAEQREAIDPERVPDGIRKMNEHEAETLARVKDLLGSKLRLEAFKRLEQKTFLKFYSVRAPAQSEPAP